MSETMNRVEQEQNLSEDSEIIEIHGGGTEGLESLSSEIEATAESFQATDFKCPECGFAHGHDTDKHRLTDSFDISHEEAANIDVANPNCHCGLNYIAMHGEEHGVHDAPSPSSAARQAPISESAKAKIRNK